jgi:hypothetical protein
MRTIVERILMWLERGAHRQRQRELERYLSWATDAADLERRMRDIARGAGSL